MIQATGTTEEGHQFIFLGLTEENIETIRDQEQGAVNFQLDPETGVNATVVLFGGRGDDDDLRARLSEYYELPVDS